MSDIHLVMLSRLRTEAHRVQSEQAPWEFDCDAAIARAGGRPPHRTAYQPPNDRAPWEIDRDVASAGAAAEATSGADPASPFSRFLHRLRGFARQFWGRANRLYSQEHQQTKLHAILSQIRSGRQVKQTWLPADRLTDADKEPFPPRLDAPPVKPSMPEPTDLVRLQ